MNPMMWRQARTVKKATEMVDDFVKDMTQGAPFLEHTLPFPNIAVFVRQEIQTGKLLGEGSYSQVYEITGVQLQDASSSSATNNNDIYSPQEDTARQDIAKDVQEDREAKKPTRYAMKQIKRDLLRKPYDFGMAIADLVVEAKYLSRLDHPNILTLRGLALGGTDALESGKFDSYFLVMDRLTDSLDQRIESWQREGPPDPKRIPRKTNYALQIANALLYLHKRRIIFRDLKPENVGFHSQHVAQLFDFGLVRELPQGFDNEVYAMSGSGSQWYMACEIFLTGKYNLKADVYSWAMTVYEMMTETKPFAKMHKLQHVALVCVQGKRPRLSQHELPKPLESVIRAAWGQSLTKRPNIQVVARSLEELLPELGDEEACVWPTVEHTSDSDYGDKNDNNAGYGGGGSAANQDDDDEISLEDFLKGTDDEIDNEIRKEAKRSPHAKPTTYGDVDDNDYSISSIVYGDH